MPCSGSAVAMLAAQTNAAIPAKLPENSKNFTLIRACLPIWRAFALSCCERTYASLSGISNF
ncbi:MAG: hypothetical protein ACJA1E_000273 [Paracoccaceae bacterium]|jgi:hypothetical protein